MKLYIWEGDGISDGYHDDGSLVVLASTVREARAVARASAQPTDKLDWEKRGNPNAAWTARIQYDHDEVGSVVSHVDRAIDRRPDRVVNLDKPRVVSFNGGGYD